MAKHRLIFTLLLEDGTYQLSRNFSLQSVGDLAWLKDFYNFNAISNSIDELILLNVSREENSLDEFAERLSELSQDCFMPISAGGRIRSLDDAKLLMRSGADKLVLNSPLFHTPTLVQELARTYGSQCVIASIDYKTVDGHPVVYTNCGRERVDLSLDACVERAEELGAGEIYLTSITQDGTGYGLDLKIVKRVVNKSKVSVIASGGVGKFEHLADGIQIGSAQAVSTAHLFNFIKDGLTIARERMRERGIDLAIW